MTLDFAEPALDGGASRRIDPAFRAHYLTIFRLCMRQLGDPCDAEDAAQETFRRALQQQGGVVGDPLPWLITVARNVCIDELRRRRSGRDALVRSATRAITPDPDGDGVTNPERVVVGRMFVNELLDCLTPAERRVVAGSLIDGRSGGELAASLGVTASTARVLLARARGKLRRYLEDGQALVTGGAFAGWRGAERLRQRLLSRPLALQARPEMLLPALVMTAVVSGATGSAATGGLVVGDVGRPRSEPRHSYRGGPERVVAIRRGAATAESRSGLRQRLRRLAELLVRPHHLHGRQRRVLTLVLHAVPQHRRRSELELRPQQRLGVAAASHPAVELRGRTLLRRGRQPAADHH